MGSIALIVYLLYFFQHGINASYIAELDLVEASLYPALGGAAAPTSGVTHGPNSSSSATSPFLRRFFSVIATASSVRWRLEEVSLEEAAAAADGAVLALGAGVEGAAEDRLGCCCRILSLTIFSILK